MLILRNASLEAFESIARNGTVHAAGRELGLTQTAITQRIKVLEQELSLTLFLRSRKGMALTEEGKALLQLCLAGRELEGQFLSQVKGGERREVSVTIAGPLSAISNRVVDYLEPLYAKYPHVRIHLRSEDHGDLVDLVRRGEADFAIVPPSQVPDEMESKMIRPTRYYLVASAKWKGRKITEILETERIIDLYESDQMTLTYLRKFELESHVKRSRLYVNEKSALIRLFISGVGFGVLTESVSQPLIEQGKLIALNKAQVVEEPLALIWYNRPQKMDYFESILRAIR